MARKGGVGLPQEGQLTESQQRQWYRALKGHAEQRGYKPGWAYYAYEAKFGAQPAPGWRSDPVVAPDDEIRRWITSYGIRRAKSNYMPKSCRHCGGTHLVKRPGNGTHKGALRCADCGRHLKWLRSDQL